MPLRKILHLIRSFNMTQQRLERLKNQVQLSSAKLNMDEFAMEVLMNLRLLKLQKSFGTLRAWFRAKFRRFWQLRLLPALCVRVCSGNRRFGSANRQVCAELLIQSSTSLAEFRFVWSRLFHSLDNIEFSDKHRRCS